LAARAESTVATIRIPGGHALNDARFLVAVSQVFQFALRPIALTNAAFIAISALTCSSNWAGVRTIGSIPIVESFAATFDACKTLRVLRWSLLTMSRDVFAGRNTPNQLGYSASTRPASVIVGTSGRAEARFGLFTASASSLP